MSSTPSSPPCTGQGTASISLSEGGGVTGTLTFTLTSQSAGCSGRLTNGGTAHLTGTLSGGHLSATDEYANAYSGTLSGGSLQVTLTSPPGPSNCVAYCRQTATFSFAGSGSLGGGALLTPVGVAAAAAGILGLGSAAGAMGIRAPRYARSHEGFTYKYDNGVFTRLDGPAPHGYSSPGPHVATHYAPAPAPAPLPDAPAALAPGAAGGPEQILGPIGMVIQRGPDLPPAPNDPTGLDQTRGGPSCPIHHAPCIPAVRIPGSGSGLYWFCPQCGKNPWG